MMITRALALLLALFTVGIAHAQTGPAFPRLAIYAIGGPHDYYISSRQDELSRYHIVVINGYPGWETWRGATYDQIAKNIKAKNPKAKVFVYTYDNEFDTSSDNALTWPEMLSALNLNRWWLYQGGSPAKSTWGTTHYLTNPTLFAPKNAQGQRFVDWHPRYLVDKFNGANSAIDGFFLDNVFWRPRVKGDWNNDGTDDDPWSNPDVGRWYREGLRSHFQTLQNLMPGKLQLANGSDWVEGNSQLAEFQGVINGALLEGVMGVEWSNETTGGFQSMMNGYRRSMQTLAAPKLGIMHLAGDPSNYREFRYGFGATLLDDGYFAYSRRTGAGDFEVHDAVWFDEYDVSLGQATTTPPTTAWQKGVYRRDFDNGIVLVNPKGNGAQDVDLEVDFRRITGKQDTGVNNGQLGKRIHLEDRDAIVLLRTTPAKRPVAPTNVTIH